MGDYALCLRRRSCSRQSTITAVVRLSDRGTASHSPRWSIILGSSTKQGMTNITHHGQRLRQTGGYGCSGYAHVERKHKEPVQCNVDERGQHIALLSFISFCCVFIALYSLLCGCPSHSPPVAL